MEGSPTNSLPYQGRLRSANTGGKRPAAHLSSRRTLLHNWAIRRGFESTSTRKDRKTWVAAETRERGVPRDDGATHPTVRRGVRFINGKFYHPDPATLHADTPIDSVKKKAPRIHLSDLPSSQGVQKDLRPVHSLQFQSDTERGLRRARCKQTCPRTGRAVVRMRQEEARLDPQREPKLVDKNLVTKTNPWQVPSNEVRLKSWGRSVFRGVHNCQGRHL